MELCNLHDLYPKHTSKLLQLAVNTTILHCMRFEYLHFVHSQRNLEVCISLCVEDVTKYY